MIDNNWIEGRNSKGCIGIFPKNYVIELNHASELDFCDSDLELSKYQKQTKQLERSRVRRRSDFGLPPDRPKTPKVNLNSFSTYSLVDSLPPPP